MRFIISFITFCGLVGVWYFIKKQPNIKYRNISALISLISFVIFGLFFREDKSQQGSRSDLLLVTSSSSLNLSTTTSGIFLDIRSEFIKRISFDIKSI